MIQPPGMVSVRQTLSSSRLTALPLSFLLPRMVLTLPGAGPFSSIKSQLLCPLPNQTWKVSPGYSPFITVYFCVAAITSSVSFACLFMSVSPLRTLQARGTVSSSHSISSFQNRAGAVSRLHMPGAIQPAPGA